jgi:hypothetical protein
LFIGSQLTGERAAVVMTNANRFNSGMANATILDVGSPASASVVQTIITGLFPREFSVGPDDATLYLTSCYDSETLQVLQSKVP